VKQNLGFVLLSTIFISLISIAIPAQTPTLQTAKGMDELVGLWKAKKRFGPDARGRLIIQKDSAGYNADFVGHRLPARVEQGEIVFDLPNNEGRFRGKADGRNILGHWLRAATVVNGFGQAFVAASPVLLKPDGPDRWAGLITPLQDEFTFYLMVQKRSDGSLGVLMRNPERDMGNQIGAERITREGNLVKLMGKRRGETQERELLSGTFDPENQILTLFIVNRGLSYDFLRDGEDSDFYPRGKNPGRYVYQRPHALDDGWTTATVEDVSIDRAGIEEFIQTIIDTPENAADTPQLHGIVIVRNGKLVVEEYFRGFSRDMFHNTRSASKSMAATVIGAVMQAGAPLKLSSPVYEVMNGGAFPPDLEQQKRAMTLENLLTMSSGIFCDDNNDKAPGNESAMWERPPGTDFSRLYLSLPLDRKPGEKAVYCSNDPNLALAMVGRVTGESPLYTFDRLVGGPMKIDNYGWPLDWAGNPYGGGGTNFVLRDFTKFGQLMLNGGTWHGRRILSQDFVTRASSPVTSIGARKYGYLWWINEYPYKDRKVFAYHALGAGGQNITVIPELDLVIGSFSGSYATKAYGYFTGEAIPKYILPAIIENGKRPRP
jgi:CubicO group peptidase (beta-lactamase class C family)